MASIPPFRPAVSLAKSAVLGAAINTGLLTADTVRKHNNHNQDAQNNRDNSLYQQNHPKMDDRTKAESALNLTAELPKTLIKGAVGGLLARPLINKLVTKASQPAKPGK